MAWETRKGRGRYYTRSTRVNGRVVRQYVGTGETAETLAELTALEREERRQQAEASRAQRESIDAVDAAVGELCEITELLARDALHLSGYHQHKRGEWRRRRGSQDTTEG